MLNGYCLLVGIYHTLIKPHLNFLKEIRHMEVEAKFPDSQMSSKMTV